MQEQEKVPAQIGHKKHCTHTHTPF